MLEHRTSQVGGGDRLRSGDAKFSRLPLYWTELPLR
jgi:hypothetical protein